MVDVEIVQLVTELSFYNQIYSELDFGTHALSITRVPDGRVYVLFVFWGLVAYKVNLGRIGRVLLLRTARSDFKCFRSDGSTYDLRVPTLLDPHNVTSGIGKDAFAKIFVTIDHQFRKSFNERLITKNSLRNSVKRINDVYKACTSESEVIDRLFAFVDSGTARTLYILVRLGEYKENYDNNLSFNANLKVMLETDEKFITTLDNTQVFFEEKRKIGMLVPFLIAGIEVYSKL